MRDLKSKLIRKNFLNSGIKLKLKEIPPSMLLEINQSFLKIWKFVRRENYNISIPLIENLSTNFKGEFFLNSLDYIDFKKSNTACVNIYFKYFVYKLIILSEKPHLSYLLTRAEYVNNQEILFFSKFFQNILSNKILRKISFSRVIPLIILKKYILAFQLLFMGKRDDRWIDLILYNTEKKLRKINFNTFSGSWTNYYSGFNLDDYVNKSLKKLEQDLDLRQKTIFNLLQKFKSDVVLDIASNKGLFSLLAARAGHSVLSIDNDISAIDHLYNFKKKYNLSIIPSVLDFNELSDANIERFRSSYVLALGFTHHLYLVEKLSWDFISRVLSKLTKKVLITEFKPDTVAHGSEKILTKSWKKNHTLKNFLVALKKYFKSVEVLNESIKQKRIVIMCKK